jgi:hypothetical protein
MKKGKAGSSYSRTRSKGRCQGICLAIQSWSFQSQGETVEISGKRGFGRSHPIVEAGKRTPSLLRLERQRKNMTGAD